MKQPSSVAEILTLVSRDPGRPRLTWYGGGGERIELSGAVLANWVSKTTNLLVEEFDAGPGVRVGLDLPPHWRGVVWALAAWRSGACVALGDAAGSADVVVTDRPEAYPDAAELVAVALPGLARRFDGTLPARALDAAGAVMTYGDQIGWTPAPAPEADAIAGDGLVIRHDRLIDWALGTLEAPDGARTLLSAATDWTSDRLAMTRSVLAVLARDGSTVLLGPGPVSELAADPARRERLLASERVTAEQ
ncbi:MAG: TIGR03089 family protein [Rhodoglobus sp.]